MIFLILGTDHHPFCRPVKWLEEIMEVNLVEFDEVVIQAGYTPITDRQRELFDVRSILPFEEMARLVSEAEVVITHGSTTAILISHLGKRPIVIPRRMEFGEHIDDHQLEFIENTNDIFNFPIPNSSSELAQLINGRDKFISNFDILSDKGAIAADKFESYFLEVIGDV